MYCLIYPGISLGEAFNNCPKPDPLDDLKYACVFWIDHLQESYQLLIQDGKESEFLGIETAYNFIAEKFLFWLEALSLCQSLSVTAKALLFLKSLPAPANLQPDHIALAEDALRFFYFFSPVIKDYPLQTYASGLLFSPKESLLRHRFKEYKPDIFAKVPEMKSDIMTMKFSSASHMLVAATWSSQTIIWQVSEDPVPEITKHENTVWPTPSPDGKWLATITTQHSDEKQEPVLQVYDLSLNRTIWTRELGNRKVRSMEISPDSEWLAVLFQEELELYDLTAGIYRVWPLDLDHEDDCLMSFSSDCALLAFEPVFESVPIQVLDLRTGTQYKNAHHKQRSDNGKFIPNTHSLMFLTDQGDVHVWHVFEQKCEEWSHFEHSVYCLAFSHSDSWVVMVDVARLFLYDRAQRTLLRELEVPTWFSLKTIAVSFDDQKIAVCTEEEIWVIDVPVLFAGNPHSGPRQKFWSIFQISDDGRLIAYPLDMKIEVWDATTSEILTSLAIGDIVHGSVEAIEFSPKARHLAFLDASSIFAWDLTNAYLRRLSASCADKSLLAFSDRNSNGGYWVAAVESLGAVSVWDIMTGKRERYVKPHDGTRRNAAGIAFANSRLGVLWCLKHLEHKSHSATFLLYNVETGEQLFRVDIPSYHGPESCRLYGIGEQTFVLLR
ncbi:Vegetative incompatibility protein HET-E-1 [Fusarium oxysporum f. sp. raphani]|uniref:Vegetative incompatibility protein HET-E-1 n=1 Tax=Fusarium oxysporum f. sp. raphani TaxID=96318 RepID=A0A8J5UMZ8_FUSOX|nr:Vegetative incompatibility protein HET-E-1 [Fusarium oxysporum f. sp. raphani]